MTTQQVFERQRAFFNTGATLDVDFRLSALIKLKKSIENKDYEERNVPKQMVCPAVAPQTGRCYGLAKYNGYFLRERSYSVSQTVSWSAKAKDTAAVKYTRFRSPGKVCHIVDGIGMPSYVQYVESYFKPEYPINENRNVDYRHGGQLNVLALAGINLCLWMIKTEQKLWMWICLLFIIIVTEENRVMEIKGCFTVLKRCVKDNALPEKFICLENM